MRSPRPKRPGKKSRPFSPPGTKSPRKRPAAGNAQKDAVREENEPLVPLTIRLPKSVHTALRRMAKADGRSATKQVEMLIRREANERLPKPAIPTSAANSDSTRPT